MAENNKNLWAPWRMDYIRSLSDVEDARAGGCFLCRYARETDRDQANRIIWRGPTCLTTFNQFPYSNGHLLIAPLAHVADLDDLDDTVLDEFVRTIRDAKRLLKEVSSAHGFNVGMNFGRCAGAGLPGHIHAHVVPRWEGDSNFMPVVGDVRVISQSIDSIYADMRVAAPKLGLPPVRA